MTRLQARRMALAAQGFTDRSISPGPAALKRVIGRLGLFQIDSVNVLQRAHYVPLYSRIGPYDVGLLDRAYGRAPRRMFEFWAHEASLVRVDLQPALRFRMVGDEMWGTMRRVTEEHPDVVAWVLQEVVDRGPVTAREIELDVPRMREGWGWNWSVVKAALEWHFFTGRVTSARRNQAFERVYDLPERVLPPDILQAPTPDEAEAHRILVEQSARAHGIGTEQCLRDYFRLAPAPARQAIDELAEDGVLVPTTIQEWRRPGYRHREAKLPRSVRARTLLSPFDPLVFERTRLEQLFGFRYRIEIYVPEPKRVHGYYVLPFLLGDALVARVDLKAERAVGRLLVKGAYAEPGSPPETAAELAIELRRLAGWLGLDDVSVEPRGDLARALTAAL